MDQTTNQYSGQAAFEKYLFDIHCKRTQCDNLIKQYTNDKETFDLDFEYGCMLYKEKFGTNYTPPKPLSDR